MLIHAAPARGLIRTGRQPVTWATDTKPQAQAMGEPRALTMAILLLVLPMFGQSFYYLLDFPIPYLLSKVWPFLMLPLSIYALVTYELPYKALFAALLAYVLGIAPLMGMLHLGNGFADALATTVKVWPFTHYFALAALLFWLRPTPRMVSRAFIILGVATYVGMWGLWILIPASWYGSDPSVGKLLPYEIERGYRIYMPMFFGILFLFYLARRFCQRWEWWILLLLLSGFGSLLYIYKQRTSILAALIVVSVGIVSSTRGRLRRFLVAISLTAAACAVLVVAGTFFDNVVQSFGGSLSVRLRSIDRAINFLGDDPLRWMFGVGATTRLGAITLADIFNDHQFYLADIGWLGIVFEYGVLSAFLLAGVYLAGLLFTWKTARSSGDPLLRALADYTFFLFLTSTVYSFVFTPGELATIVAFAAYLQRYWASAPVAAPVSDRIVPGRGTNRFFQGPSSRSRHAEALSETHRPSRL
ncbi:hypothetical protein EDC65_0033 [Stella humosa]|uniref:O-antigen ligase-like membrane protein n=1 Tax=Stella humosa TaxID=94 RepID=A0A3N1MI49_9PROT|nr:hypothetical protein [Stella humosa]ROQ03351.1 hypothetical protein EDC65_0033 [Stella humosa]BBK29638.1 hypothetical protein STHU_02720 [Stella humosa]